MNIQQAKHIPITDYLTSLGYKAVKEGSATAWFHSPLREDKDPSFKVNKISNLWYDFGMGIGGDIIKLAQSIIKDENITKALSYIEKKVPCAVNYNNNFTKNTDSPTLNKYAVYPLNNQALIEYIKERGVNIELAKRKCKQVFFENNGKKYFAIGFANTSNGYELRNKFYKGCIGNKNYSYISNGSNEILVFEGFFDFLSYLTEYPDGENAQDFIILNSVVNATKVIELLQKYDIIYCYLDNDNAGNECFMYLKNNVINKEIYDCRTIYKDYKDYNIFLLASKKHL